MDSQLWLIILVILGYWYPQTNGVDSDRTRDIQNPSGQPVPNDIPPKYLEIDFYPNQPMSENAAQAIEARDAQVGENRGITPYAESCANRIIQNKFSYQITGDVFIHIVSIMLMIPIVTHGKKKVHCGSSGWPGVDKMVFRELKKLLRP